MWEAADWAAFHGLSNLCAIIDLNRLGQSGPTMHQHHAEVFEQRLQSFGWETAVVDGHDVAALKDAFARARQSAKPFAIVARTLKGKGVSFVEDKDGLARQAPQEGGGREGAGRAGRHQHHAEGRAAALRRRAAPAGGTGHRHPRLREGPGGRDARGLRHRAGQAGQERAPDRGHRRRHQELDVLRAVQGRRPRAVRGGLHRGAEHGGGRPRHVHRGQDPVRLHLRLLPHPRLRLHPHGHALAAEAPRPLRQPRRRLHRRGRPFADGPRGPGHDARAGEVDRALPERRRLRGEARRSGRAHRRRRVHPHQPPQDARALRATTRRSPSAGRRRCGGPTRTR